MALRWILRVCFGGAARKNADFTKIETEFMHDKDFALNILLNASKSLHTLSLLLQDTERSDFEKTSGALVEDIVADLLLARDTMRSAAALLDQFRELGKGSLADYRQNSVQPLRGEWLNIRDALTKHYSRMDEQPHLTEAISDSRLQVPGGWANPVAQLRQGAPDLSPEGV